MWQLIWKMCIYIILGNNGDHGLFTHLRDIGVSGQCPGRYVSLVQNIVQDIDDTINMEYTMLKGV